jgi:hypothetical protein
MSALSSRLLLTVFSRICEPARVGLVEVSFGRA